MTTTTTKTDTKQQAPSPPVPCEPPKHRFDTDKKGYIIADKCRCGKLPLRRST